jgi:hypothetical protein
MAGMDLAVGQQAAEARGDLALRCQAARGVDAVVERRVAAGEALDAERAGGDRRTEQCFGAEQPSMASAVLSCVPLSSASPSLASRRSARAGGLAHGRALRAARHRCMASPSPISASARCASGARSPEAPTEPRPGMIGRTRPPAARAARRRLRADAGHADGQAVGLEQHHAPHEPGGRGSPTPQAWLRTRLYCSWAAAASRCGCWRRRRSRC